jgi:hypothetical protein
MMALELINKATSSTGFSYELLKKMDVDPEQYEVHKRHPTGVVIVLKEGCTFPDAADCFFKATRQDIAEAVDQIKNIASGD